MQIKPVSAIKWLASVQNWNETLVDKICEIWIKGDLFCFFMLFFIDF